MLFQSRIIEEIKEDLPIVFFSIFAVVKLIFVFLQLHQL